jgi:thioredoxin 1
MRERLTIEKINVAAHPYAARALGVRGVPSLLLYRGGLLKAMHTGAISGPQLRSWLASHGLH